MLLLLYENLTLKFLSKPVVLLLQLIDVQTKFAEETRRASKAEFEVQNKMESMKNLQAEKEVNL